MFGTCGGCLPLTVACMVCTVCILEDVGSCQCSAVIGLSLIQIQSVQFILYSSTGRAYSTPGQKLSVCLSVNHITPHISLHQALTRTLILPG